ncbi:8713_t:CDS:2 [Funneliformis geosporum]|nr:8713_t:CDS:2 [Funneliformis geosporum]
MRNRHTCEEADAKRLIKKGLTPEPFLYEIPELGGRFEYIVVENDLSQKVGDKMEYPKVVRQLDIYQPSSEAVLEALKKLKDSNKAEYYSANATILSPEALEEIRNSRGKVKNAVMHKHALDQPDCAQQDIISSDPFLHLREIPSSQNSDNEKSSHDDTSTFGGVLETKKEYVSKIPLSSSLSPIILQDSENALEVFKKAQNGMEKAIAKGAIVTAEKPLLALDATGALSTGSPSAIDQSSSHVPFRII